jgi:hypothetical protein
MKHLASPPDYAHPDTGHAARHLASRNEFLTRALKSREDSRRTGVYFDAVDVHAALEAKLRAKQASGKPGLRSDP